MYTVLLYIYEVEWCTWVTILQSEKMSNSTHIAEIPSVIVIKMFRINTDSWKFQVLSKCMDCDIFLSVQNFSNIYTKGNYIVPFILTSYELSIFCQDETSFFCIHSSRITCARRGGVEVAGLTVDREIRIRFLVYPHHLWYLWWQGG